MAALLKGSACVSTIPVSAIVGITLCQPNIWRVLEMIVQAYQNKERVTFLVFPAYEGKAMRNWLQRIKITLIYPHYNIS